MDTASNTYSDRQFVEGARRRWNRKWETLAAKDLDDLISQSAQNVIISNSRKLYANHGIVRGTINQKAMYAVGQAFLPRFLGKDKDWKETATDWLNNWYKTCNVSGFDFQTTLYLISVAVDRDGDSFVLLTETDSKYPQIQLIPAHQVGQRNDDKIVGEGRYKGMKIKKGVIFSKRNRPVAYRVLGETPAQDRDISAQDLIPAMDPEYAEQSRGLGLFSHAINQFKDMAESTEKELTAQLLLASIAFIEHNPFGGADETNATSEFESIDGNPTCVNYDEGSIKFFKSGDGSKLEAVTNNRPSAEWQAFHDRLERISLVGTGWPRVLVDAAKGNGVADRIALRQGQRAVEDRQALLKPIALRMVTYAIARAIKLELLAFNEEFYKWKFSVPPFLSIDFGRDSNAVRAEYLLGIRNLTDILEENGQNLEDHLRTRAIEDAHKILIRQEIEQAYGVTLPVMNPEQDAQTAQEPQTPQQPQS